MSLLLNTGLWDRFLANKRSVDTRHAYQGDLTDFCRAALGLTDLDILYLENFACDTRDAIASALADYRAHLIQRGLAPATVNRRLSCVRSLVEFAWKSGCRKDRVEGLVTRERSQAYRDTKGISVGTMRALMTLPDGDTVKDLRDRAILRLFWETAMRRAEICALNLGDLNGNRLMISGKGQNGEKTPITITPATIEAIRAYIQKARLLRKDDPLFITMDHRSIGTYTRLQRVGLNKILSAYGEMLGRHVTPHQIRHGSITRILEKTDGDVRLAQRLSRHKNLETLMTYDDNRRTDAGKAAAILADDL